MNFTAGEYYYKRELAPTPMLCVAGYPLSVKFLIDSATVEVARLRLAQGHQAIHVRENHTRFPVVRPLRVDRHLHEHPPVCPGREYPRDVRPVWAHSPPEVKCPKWVIVKEVEVAE